MLIKPVLTGQDRAVTYQDYLETILNLTRVLGVSPKAAENDACLMEHDISRETFEKLLFFLHNQEIDKALKKEVGWAPKGK